VRSWMRAGSISSIPVACLTVAFRYQRASMLRAFVKVHER
jgi:hypothetical protein